MNDKVENLILEQLRGIGEEMGAMRSDIEEIKAGQQSLQGMLFGLAGYIRGIDQRVEHNEAKLGIEEV